VYVAPKSLKKWHKTRCCCLASKIYILSKEVCYKVYLCENFQRHSCRYIIPDLTVHIWIASDVPIYLKFALKVTHPFRQISCNSASAVTAVRDSKKSSIITNRKSIVRAIDELGALLLSPLKDDSKRKFYI